MMYVEYHDEYHEIWNLLKFEIQLNNIFQDIFVFKP